MKLSTPPYFDAHTHLDSPSPCPQILCAVDTYDWDEIIQRSKEAPSLYYPALGIHPWKAALHSTKDLNILKRQLLNTPHALVGEIGLDKSPRLKASFDHQLDLFNSQYNLAQSLERPTVIHCVKAWNELLSIFKKNPPQKPTLLHSFYASKEVFSAIKNQNVYFSFSPKQMNFPNLPSLLKMIPLNRLCVESDGSSWVEFIQFIDFLSAEIEIPKNDFIEINAQHCKNFLNI